MREERPEEQQRNVYMQHTRPSDDLQSSMAYLKSVKLSERHVVLCVGVNEYEIDVVFSLTLKF